MTNSASEHISETDLAYLVQSEARLRLILQSLPYGLCVFNPRHLLVTIFKQPENVPPVPGLIEGRPPDILAWGAANVLAFTGKLNDVFQNGRTERFQLHLSARREQPARHLEITLSKMETNFVLAVFRDVTEDARERAQDIAEAQRQSHVSKQESLFLLAAGIAHDVNNILGVVLSTAEAHWMDAEDEETIIAVDTIRDAVRRGTSMTRELMTFAGETHGNLKRIEDPTSLVRESSRLVRSALNPNIVLTYDLPAGLPAIDADPTQFWKVIFNLIKNAGEAMRDHPGEIDVSAYPFEMTAQEADTFTTPFTPRSGKGVLFSIADNGPGIPPGILRRIFDPYISSKSVNRGLGLAIVNSIIEAHGGGIRVQSQEGVGTVFEIFMPVSRQAAPQPAVPSTTAKPVASAPDISTKTSVLIVDDEPNIVRTTSILLKMLKFTPYSASDRHEAILSMRSLAPSLRCILMDAHLGEIDTARLLRAFRLAVPQLPVVILSGSSEAKIAESFASQPYDAFLAKPFTFAELKDCLSTLVRKA